MNTTVAVWRRAAAELIGTAGLVAVVVGSGIMAQGLSADGAVRLLANSTTTVFGLAVLILILGPVSGAHFNPIVSIADWWLGRRTGTGLTTRDLGVYVVAQIAGGIIGAVVANLMFDLPAISWSTTGRDGSSLWLGEVVASAGLILCIFALVRSGRTTLAPAAVAIYIGAAYWFTSSTSFANPAVTAGRMFSDTYTGIAPTSVPGFVTAQLVGLLAGLSLLALLYPSAPPADRPSPATPGHTITAEGEALNHVR